MQTGRTRIGVLGGRPPHPTGTAEMRTRGYSRALGAVRALHTAGIRVPQDVAAGRFAVPSLATVSPDKPQLAREAVRLLLRSIEDHRASSAGKAVPPAREVVIEHTLLTRESTGSKNQAPPRA